MFNETDGFKTERVIANGLLNGGKPVKRLLSLGVLGGAAAGTVEIYDAVDASAVANKRGGVTAPLGQWGWGPGRLNLQLATGKCFLNGFGANAPEAVAVYEPMVVAPT